MARATLAAQDKEAPLPADPGRHRRIAATYLVDGNAKAAMSELGLGLGATPDALGLHLTMAMTDLWLGDGKTAASHAAAAKSGNPNLARLAALVEAMAGKDYAGAHQAAQVAIREAPNEAQAAGARVLDAMVSVAEGRGDEAMKTLNEAGPNAGNAPMVRALAAQRKGDMGAARSISYEILGSRQLALANLNAALARGVAQRILAAKR